MPELKEAEINQLVREVTGKDPLDRVMLGSGMFSTAYRLDFDEAPFVLRIGSSYTPFIKDAWAYALFPKEILPIPRIMDRGPWGKHFYCFSEYKKGLRMDLLEPRVVESLLPEIFRIHSQISSVELPEDNFFGFLDPSGQGIYPSWKAALTNFQDWPATILSRKEERFLDWGQVYRKTFLEEKLVGACKENIREHLKFCPEWRGLIHGDFGFDNMLIYNGAISAVLDWAESRCGDPLYDIASLQCHSGGINYRKAYKAKHESEGSLPEYFDQRVDCYMTYILLCSCWLDAQRDNEDYYKDAKEKLKAMGLV